MMTAWVGRMMSSAFCDESASVHYYQVEFPKDKARAPVGRTEPRPARERAWATAITPFCRALNARR